MTSCFTDAGLEGFGEFAQKRVEGTRAMDPEGERIDGGTGAADNNESVGAFLFVSIPGGDARRGSGR